LWLGWVSYNGAAGRVQRPSVGGVHERAEGARGGPRCFDTGGPMGQQSGRTLDTSGDTTGQYFKYFGAFGPVATPHRVPVWFTPPRTEGFYTRGAEGGSPRIGRASTSRPVWTPVTVATGGPRPWGQSAGGGTLAAADGARTRFPFASKRAGRRGVESTTPAQRLQHPP